MSFLSPIPLAIWSYVAIAAVLLAVGAYIIKMRRRRFEVPFSQLWKRVLEQKDANALWKQLRRLMSLLLILVVLAAILFAALDPTLGATDRRARNVVVLLDASASMKALDGEGGKSEGAAAGAPASTRLDAAKKRAVELVDSMGGGDLAMIIKVDGQATPLSRFTSDAPMLRKIIDGATASDTPADLPRALAAAADALRDRKNPLIVLISDGAFPDAQLGLASFGAAPPARDAAAPPPVDTVAGAKAAAWGDKNLATVDLSGIDVRYLPVGRRSDNAGIVAFNVRRYVANKAAYEVFIELQNFGSEPAQRRLTLYNGATAVDVRTLTLGPGQRDRQIYRELPGGEDNRLRATLTPIEGGAADPFPLDDEAFALLPARKKQKVLLVTVDNLYLEGAVMVYDNIEPAKITPAEYDANPAIADGFAVVIFDEHTPAVVPPPPANLLYFHPTGEHSPVRITGTLARPRITEIDEAHPVMRWVGLSDVNFDKSEVFAPDRAKGEVSMARSVRDCIAVAKREAGRKIAAFGFSLPAPDREDATDLPLRVAFPLLLVNTLDWFAGDEADLLTTYTTGRRERVALDGAVVSGSGEVAVTAPDGSKTTAPVLDGQATFYAGRVGFYQLETPGPDPVRTELAANLSSPGESDIAPSTKLSLGGVELAAPESFAVTRSRQLWLYFVLLAAILIGLEWITYHRRVTV
jgi:Ca-activated chloride channel homolog